MMRSVRIQLCESEADFEQFTFYMLKHRRSMHAAFGVKELFYFVHSVFQHGAAILASTADGEVAGAAGYVIGTPENHFADSSVIRVEIAHIREEFRGGLLFLRGMRHMLDHWAGLREPAAEPQFYISADRRDLCRLLGKFAKPVETKRTKFGNECLFSASPDEWYQYLGRFRGREEAR